jgi:hypothetical protein
MVEGAFSENTGRRRKLHDVDFSHTGDIAGEFRSPIEI